MKKYDLKLKNFRPKTQKVPINVPSECNKITLNLGEQNNQMLKSCPHIDNYTSDE